MSNRSKFLAYFTLILLVLIYISSFVDRQIIAVLATYIREDLGLSNTQIGILYGPAFSFIYAFCGLFMGRLADQFSRKYIIITGLVIWSLMTVASGFASSLAFLITARFFVGVSQSALSPSVYSLLADYFKPEERGTVYSIYASGIFIGIAFSFLVGGSVAQAFDWRTSLKVVGVPGLVLAGITIFCLKEPRRIISEKNEGITPVFETLRFILKKRTVQYYLLGFSLLSMLGYTHLAFVSTIFRDEFGAPEFIPKYGWFMLATGASMMIAGYVADRFAKKWGPEKRFVIPIIAALVPLPLYYFGLFAETAVTAFWLIGIANVISSCYNGIAAALIQYFVKPDMRGIAGALYLFVISVVGFGFGPPLAGWLMDNVFTGVQGVSEALISIYVVCGIGASFAFFMAMKNYHQDAEIQES